jgi:PAS domain S-box-containing protein
MPLPAPPQYPAEAFEHAAVGMAIVALDGRCLQVNRALCEMLGNAPATLGEIFRSDDSAEAQRLLRDGSATPRELRYLHRDGKPRWGRFTGTLIRDAAGAPARFLVQAQDVSELRRTAEALRESEERLRSLDRLSSDWFWQQDGELRFTSIADQERDQHFEGHDVVGLRRWELPDVTPLTTGWDEHRQLLARRQPFRNFTYLRRLASGAPSYVAVSGEPVFDDAGQFRGYRGTARDITASMLVDQQVRLLAEQLSTTLESVTDAFFTVDREWRFTYLNPEAERLLRQPRAQLQGRSLWQAFPDLVGTPSHAHYLRAMLDQAAVQLEEYYEPFDVWVHVKAYPSRQGLAVFMRDMTERVRAQNEILRLNAELEERVRQRTEDLQVANRDLESFSYSIAHDLRAPLASIDGFSQVLEQQAGQAIDGRNLHYVRRIRNAVRHMSELTDGLLLLARLARASLRREPVDLARLARDALEACLQQAPQRQVELAMAPSLPAEGDPRLLAQVMGNLVGNAWKFTARTAQARIEIGMEQGDGQPVFFVRDNGAGFDMAYASRLFEAFQRLHASTEFEGTGIGLAIVHRIVDRHGGRIWAEASPGQGACFRFTLAGQRSPLR